MDSNFNEYAQEFLDNNMDYYIKYGVIDKYANYNEEDFENDWWCNYD